MSTIVMVAGDFGHIHQGHVDHIVKAYSLGNYLIIVTHTDDSIRERKGYEPTPLWARIIILKGLISLLGGEGEVMLALDTDGKCRKTLRKIKPDIFAKGGEYTLSTLPQEEISVCEECGIRIIFGVGERLALSRELADL